MNETKSNIGRNQQPATRKLVYNWYALYTKSRQGKKGFQELSNMEIEAYFPLETIIRQWSDRKKKVKEPMVRSYVFVKTSELEYYDVLNTTGEVRYISFEGKTVAIPEWQIDAMKNMLDHKLPHHYSTDQSYKGEFIKITEGPLTGCEGEIVNDFCRETESNY